MRAVLLRNRTGIDRSRVATRDRRIAGQDQAVELSGKAGVDLRGIYDGVGNMEVIDDPPDPPTRHRSAVTIPERNSRAVQEQSIGFRLDGQAMTGKPNR